MSLRRNTRKLKAISEETRELNVIKLKEGKKVRLGSRSVRELENMAYIADQKAMSWGGTMEGLQWRDAKNEILKEIAKKKQRL
ncbi:hypothetical protein H0N95_01020 [Candidatus Micrarchaeota archaeon]|nr:hypothetical protein [Candidatus Micrarchaeota archaeon]